MPDADPRSKRVRYRPAVPTYPTGRGYWNQVDVFIRKHTDPKFTHGLCPDCIKKYFPDQEEL